MLNDDEFKINRLVGLLIDNAFPCQGIFLGVIFSCLAQRGFSVFKGKSAFQILLDNALGQIVKPTSRFIYHERMA
jgi:hypothetical protein